MSHSPHLIALLFHQLILLEYEVKQPLIIPLPLIHSGKSSTTDFVIVQALFVILGLGYLSEIHWFHPHLFDSPHRVFRHFHDKFLQVYIPLYVQTSTLKGLPRFVEDSDVYKI